MDCRRYNGRAALERLKDKMGTIKILKDKHTRLQTKNQQIQMYPLKSVWREG